MTARILIDCDGVLADFTGALCRSLRLRGFNRHADSVLHWDLASSLTPPEMAMVDEIVSEPGWCSDIEWFPGAKNTVRALRHAGHELICVTSPWPSRTWMAERLDWLSPLFHRQDVIFAPAKHKPLVAGDLLIEDHPGTCGRWLASNPGCTALLIDRPWNSHLAKEFWPHVGMFRVSGHYDLIAHVDGAYT